MGREARLDVRLGQSRSLSPRASNYSCLVVNIFLGVKSKPSWFVSSLVRRPIFSGPVSVTDVFLSHLISMYYELETHHNIACLVVFLRACRGRTWVSFET